MKRASLGQVYIFHPPISKNGVPTLNSIWTVDRHSLPALLLLLHLLLAASHVSLSRHVLPFYPATCYKRERLVAEDSTRDIRGKILISGGPWIGGKPALGRVLGAPGKRVIEQKSTDAFKSNRMSTLKLCCHKFPVFLMLCLVKANQKVSLISGKYI